MPKVKIQKTLSVQAEKLFAAVQDVLTHDKELKALEPNLEICDQNVCADKLSANVTGSRIDGKFSIKPQGDSSTIDIELKLPLMLAPFKSVVQKKIEEKLDRIS
ncbi:MAG: polyhydroxyalkanoic acid system family protein [Bdellovibrionales bacterium]